MSAIGDGLDTNVQLNKQEVDTTRAVRSSSLNRLYESLRPVVVLVCLGVV